MAEKNEETKRDRSGKIIFSFRILYLLASIVVIFKILSIMLFYSPNEKLLKRIKSKSEKNTIEAIRGSIYSYDDKLLASSIPSYQVYMDCSVQKEHNLKAGAKGKKKEREWHIEAEKLSKELANFFKDKSAQEYYNLIITNRNKNNKFVKIGHRITHKEFLTVSKFPLFCKSKFTGGFIPQVYDTRQYPYGGMARRVIGYVRNNEDTEGNIKGIEGSYNAYLHGTNGWHYLKRTDSNGKIIDLDSAVVEVKHGYDIKTTIDVKIQDIADKALRKLLQNSNNVSGACAIVLDVKTGAIRTMANLNRNKDGTIGETLNYAITEVQEPGSVFKAATLMTLLEDNKVDTSTTVPTYKGVWKYADKVFRDEYLRDYPTPEINIIDAFKISSNNAFRYLACKYYEDDPRRYVDKLYEYKLFETFDFDIKGLRSAYSPNVDDASWSGTSLPSIAIGYSVGLTPLHTVSFYNAIANKGEFMKPYLVDEIIENGEVIKKVKPTILNGSICSKQTAKEISYALRKVVLEGTGRALKGLECEVVGKTGTARMLIDYERNGKKYKGYLDDKGNKRHQASFVGFFPYKNPKYTAIVVVYSTIGHHNLYGAQYALPVFKEIVQNTYITDGSWRAQIKSKADFKKMEDSYIPIQDKGSNIVPDLSDLGLMDAIYAIESCGYECLYSGIGHVVSQSPKAGTKLSKGNRIKINLK